LKRPYAYQRRLVAESPPARGARIETRPIRAVFEATLIAPRTGGAD